MKVVIVGKDARTDAIGRACSSNTGVTVYAVTEHQTPSMNEYCDAIKKIPVTDGVAISDWVKEVGADVVIVGPEEPLESGIVDVIESRTGARCFGPPRALARVESSKSWTRRLLDKYGIKANPHYCTVESRDELLLALRNIGDYVIKPDGLTGGKGVKVKGEHLDCDADAIEYVQELLTNSSGPVVVEERLDGEEFSLQTITDGSSVIHCPVVQDHKRAFDGDKGPNTGGMGSYSGVDHSLPFLSMSDVATARLVNEQVIRALRAETGVNYRGVLYGGFMATADGVRLIEYNARFGDPEALNVLPILEGDFARLCWDVASGRLDPSSVRFAKRATVCKYVVPEQYPDGGSEGMEIRVPSWIDLEDDVHVYWAAVNQGGPNLPITLTRSRSVAFVGVGSSISAAEKLAQRAVEGVEGPVRFRADIGSNSLIEQRIKHMNALRSV